MAKELLDAICAAEEAFSRRESEAKAQSAQTAAQAKKDAEALIAQRVAKANADADAAVAQAKCAAISAAAEKNRPAVIKKAAEALLA